jgi:hypothetical protein
MSIDRPIDPLALTRRHFLSASSLGLGGLALGALLPRGLARPAGRISPPRQGG